MHQGASFESLKTAFGHFFIFFIENSEKNQIRRQKVTRKWVVEMLTSCGVIGTLNCVVYIQGVYIQGVYTQREGGGNGPT